MDNWTVSTAGQYVRQSCFGHIFADNIGDVDDIVDDDADDDIDNDGDGDNAENSGSDGDGDNICGGK